MIEISAVDVDMTAFCAEMARKGGMERCSDEEEDPKEVQEIADSADTPQEQESSKESSDDLLVSPEDLATTLKVLALLARDEAYYRSAALRDLRCAMIPLMEYTQKGMFKGIAKEDYKKQQIKKIRKAHIQNQNKQQDKAFVQKTQLRAGRMQKLEKLAQQDGANIGHVQSIQFLLDGVADDGSCINATNLSMVDFAHRKAAAPALTVHGEDADASVHAAGLSDSTTDVHVSPPQRDAEGQSGAQEQEQEQEQLHGAKQCYTCKRRFRQLHHFYDSLCPGCAELNWDKRLQTCDMSGRVCLVTGGRVKIGFQCCLKLLRCGATVISTSRFPADAALRFSQQQDFADWRTRVHCYGLDLRDLAAVEEFCSFVQQEYQRLDVIINNACQTVRRPAAYYTHLLQFERSASASARVCESDAGSLLLDGTASPDKEKEFAVAEPGSGPNHGLGEAVGGSSMQELLQHQRHLRKYSSFTAESRSGPSYEASQIQLLPEDAANAFATNAAGAGATNEALAITESDSVGEEISARSAAPGDSLGVLPSNIYDVNAQQLDLRKHNSWCMRMHEVSTPEVAEVMAINAIAPFILNARLKNLMARTAAIATNSEAGGEASSDDTRDKKYNEHRRDGRDYEGNGPQRTGAAKSGSPVTHVHHSACVFIVNVSAMEGKFYRRKLPTHPHTNMAKAALNMMTRTSATDYSKAGIFMTAVDTGWINDENPLEIAIRINSDHDFATPLDEVDAAARILDPVFAPLIEGQTGKTATAESGASGIGYCSPAFGSFLKDFYVTEW